MLRLFETEESPAVSIVYYLNHTYKHLHLIFTMSATPKRSHEESAHSSSKYRFEDAGPYPKLSTSVLAEYRPPYEIGQDTRLVKIPRTESRDMDRRSPLPTMYRMLPSSNDSHVDYPATSENRLESKDSKDSRDYRFDNRDTNLEMRELYGETRKDSVHAKNDKDVRYDSSRDDNNEIKYDRESNNDTKSEVKMVKDGCGVSSGHLHRKESKEYHRGKRYSDILPGITDPWISRSNLHGYSEISKEGPAVEEKDHMEGQGAVGDSKFDSHGEDKFKDKDRKRKDEKHRDLGERNKERSDHLSSMHVANISNEYREPAKEDRDVERKDPAKDKERLKEKEKGHTKREMWDGVDKETSHNEKALGDGSNIMLEQENLASEKNQKEVDRRKSFDKESKDRRNEKDVDVDRDGSEKHDKGYDKESNDGGADEGASEREQEVYNYGIQQHRRMQRSRGSPHLPNREPHFRTRPQGNEGSQDKTEVSSVIYKVGECMQNLIKLWREYEVSQVDKHSDSSHNGPSLEIRIPAEHVIAINRQVRGGQLWGTDIYTDDSDLVAVLMHTGYCRPTACPPPPAIQELHATIRVLPPQDFYISTLRNNVRSRAWGAGIGCSYQVERCCFMKKGGGTIDLERCITRTSTVEPTLEPVSVERTMTTRSTASNAFRQQRLIQEITIQYNLCNEPWIKYSISIVADKGLKKPLYTSARLRKGEVLYLETHTCRYELCFAGEKMIRASQASHVHEEEPEKSQCHHLLSTNDERNDSDNSIIDVFRWSHCKKPLPQKVMRSVGIPLPLEYMEVLEDNLNWEDIQWSQTGVWVAGKEYTLARVHFLSMN